MKFSSFLKDRTIIIITNLIAIIFAGIYLLKIGNSIQDIFIISSTYIFFLLLSLYLMYIKRKNYLEFILRLSRDIDNKNEILDLLPRLQNSEDEIYREIIQLINSNRSLGREGKYIIENKNIKDI